MRFAQELYLIRRNLSQSPGRTFWACLGVGVGMTIFLAALSLAWGVQFGILPKIKEAMPEKLISARRMNVDIGPLRLPTALITEAEAQRIREMDEVEAVWPQIPISFPIRAEGELIGVRLSTDVVVNGIEPALAEDDVAPGKTFSYDPDPSKNVPVIASKYLLDLYNLGYAEANSLPKLSESFIIGRHFQLVLGQSTLPALGNDPDARSVRCEVVGLTANPSLLGVVIPSEYVAQYNREFKGTERQEYNALHIKLRDVSGLEAVETELAKLKLQPDSKRELLRRLQFFLGILLVVVILFSALVLVVAFSNVVNVFSLILLQRRFEIGLLRAVGLTRWGVMRLFLGEAGLIGLAGGILGAIAALAISMTVNHLCQSYLPPLSILPEGQDILVFNWPLAIGGALFAAAVSKAATLPIVLRETARQPAVLLKQD
jgi:putative ABC transport system permease protein